MGNQFCFPYLSLANQTQTKSVEKEANTFAVAIVDPYSSGRFLVYELTKRNIPIVCVRSSLKLGAFFLASYETHKDYFVRTVDYDGELSRTISDLVSGPQKIKAIVAGCEPGVELADQLSEALGVAGNGTNLTWARRDKAGMQDRLRECGVPSAEQMKSSGLEELLCWARERQMRVGSEVAYPVVVKPTGGSGGEGVFFCDSEDDIINAHKELLGSTQSGNGCKVEQLALQEYLTGTEYIVDTCSLKGGHLCCAVWRYNKRKGVPWSPQSIVTQSQEILASDDPVCETLVSYVFQVLDAVGLVHGPCHTEVMLTPRGPILVEVNARMHGVQGPLMIEKATGTGLASYVADAMMDGWQGDGGLLKKHLEAGRNSTHGRWMYPREQCAGITMLISHFEGFLEADVASQVSALNLPSVMEVFPSVKKGALLRQTIDLHSNAGYAVMLHPSPNQMDQDIAAIRTAEESGSLYPVTRVDSVARQISNLSVGSPLASRQVSPSLEKAGELWGRSMASDEDFVISGLANA